MADQYIINTSSPEISNKSGVKLFGSDALGAPGYVEFPDASDILYGGRTISEVFDDIINVKKYGAKGDGVTNDTAAIHNALAAAFSFKRPVYFPYGIYLYNGGGQLGTGVVVFGAGRNATIIKSALGTPTSGYIFRCLGNHSSVKSMRFEANTPQVGGHYVQLRGGETSIEDFYMTGDYCGIWMVGNVSSIRNGRMEYGASGAIRIKAEGGDNSQVIDGVLIGAQSPDVVYAGIRVRNSSALTIVNTSVLQQGRGLLIDPTTGTQDSDHANGSVFSLLVDNSFFDHCGDGNIVITPSGTGSVVRARFSNVWAGSSPIDGVIISNFGSGVLSGITFENPHIFLNGGSGIATGQGVSNLNVDGGAIGGNLHGMYINDLITGLRVTGALIGKGEGIPGNTNHGLTFHSNASGSNDIIIKSNNMKGNGAGAISNNATLGADVLIEGNLGATALSWTPTLSFESAGDLAVTYSSRVGTFARNGNIVVAFFQISTSSFSHTTAAGGLIISGLPFQSQAAGKGDLEYSGIVKNNYTDISLIVSAGSSQVKFRASGSGKPISPVSSIDVPSGGSVVIRGSVTYFV